MRHHHVCVKASMPRTDPATALTRVPVLVALGRQTAPTRKYATPLTAKAMSSPKLQTQRRREKGDTQAWHVLYSTVGA
jgi:hypothetical protein